jgi:hypothetical protein
MILPDDSFNLVFDDKPTESFVFEQEIVAPAHDGEIDGKLTSDRDGFFQVIGASRTKKIIGFPADPEMGVIRKPNGKIERVS